MTQSKEVAAIGPQASLPAVRRLVTSAKDARSRRERVLTAEAGRARPGADHAALARLAGMGSVCACGGAIGAVAHGQVIENGVPDIPDGLVQFIHGVADLAAHGVIAHHPQYCLEIQARGEQPADHDVVQDQVDPLTVFGQVNEWSWLGRRPRVPPGSPAGDHGSAVLGARPMPELWAMNKYLLSGT